MKSKLLNSLKTAFSALLAASIASLCFGTAHAADPYPSKPVRIVYPFSPGGGMEVVMRVLAQNMQLSTGQPFLIDNRTGAGGAIAAQAAATAAPDGYTLLVVPTGIMSITPHLRKLPYDTEKDLIPVARLSEFKGVLVVGTQVPANNVQEFIAYAKAHPGKINYATSGVGSQGHLNGETLQRGWGIQMTHIPYKGAADMVSDLLANRLDMVADVTMLQYVKQGKAKLLGVFGDKRLDDFPDVPAVGELPVPQVNREGTWFGAFAPKGTPPEIVDKLATEFEKALKHPDVATRMRPFAISAAFLGPKDFRKVWENDYSVYGKVIKDLNIKTE
ncbi:Bug family tripartite tricarboxylate transporter substrate binding protein [Propionivibrio sp.]|uniref:Bug family tripartite tricarboxylate transporter substrate binding protein n=1 Tax=Propionivibrio sp. TaxID=2212460 RepID=UPI003BF1420B